MGQGIIKIFFIVFLGLSALSTTANAAPKSLETCINEISRGLTDKAIDTARKNCYLDDMRNSLKIKSESSEISLISSSYTLDLGLGEPIFSGLKRKRDEFIYEYLDKNISKVKSIQRENIRRFNLKTIMSNSAGENAMISNLKKIFNLTSIESMIREFKEKRLSRCQEEADSKRASCDSFDKPLSRQQCEAEAEAVLDNCFKFSSNPTSLVRLQNKLKEIENGILDKISKVSFVNNDEFDSLVSSIMTGTQNIDDRVSSINRATNLDFDGKLGDLISGDSTTTIEMMIAERAGISMTLVGPGSWREAQFNPDNELLNYKIALNTTKINNICDLTKCLVYPSSKKYKADGTATDGYKSMCLDQNLTEEYLNKLVNQARKKLTVIVSKMVLQEVMTRIGVDALMDKVKNALICGQAATSMSLSDGANDIFGDGSLENMTGALSSILGGAPKVRASSEKVVECLGKIEDTTKATIKETEFGLIKCGGPVGHIYVASGAANIPFGCIKIQGKAEGENIVLLDPKTEAAINACMAEGESKSWVQNYDACVAADGNFKFGSGFGADLNIGIGSLFKWMNKISVGQCKGLLSPDRRSSFGGTLSIIANPLIAQDPNNLDTIFLEVSSKLIQAKKELYRSKVDATKYLPTEQMLCANNALEVLKKNSYYTDFIPCKVLDHELDDSLVESRVPTIKVKDLLSGFQFPNTPVSPPVNLLPSVIDLCSKSADYVIDNLTKEFPVGDETKIDSPSDPRSPGSPLVEDPPVISKAISNVNKCSMFLDNMELVLPRSDIDIDTLIEKEKASSWILKQMRDTSYVGGIMIDDALFQYKETMQMFSRRSDIELFSICIKNEDKDWEDKPDMIQKARHVYCKGYRISLFDRYYDEAGMAFNYPITDQPTRMKVDKYIDAQTRKYREGSW